MQPNWKQHTNSSISSGLRNFVRNHPSERQMPKRRIATASLVNFRGSFAMRLRSLGTIILPTCRVRPKFPTSHSAATNPEQATAPVLVSVAASVHGKNHHATAMHASTCASTECSLRSDRPLGTHLCNRTRDLFSDGAHKELLKAHDEYELEMTTSLPLREQTSVEKTPPLAQNRLSVASLPNSFGRAW